jgi:hypothetical protein
MRVTVFRGKKRGQRACLARDQKGYTSGVDRSILGIYSYNVKGFFNLVLNPRKLLAIFIFL